MAKSVVNTFTLTAQGPFSLASSLTFLEGFAPASYEGVADGVLELAFPVQGTWQSVGVRVRQRNGGVAGEIVSPAAPDRTLSSAIRAQVARILSLDVDGSGFPAVGERDPVVGGLQNRYPGLRPVCFYSPYEAAAWAIIGHRVRIRQAAAIKARMAQELGEPISFDGRAVHAFPAPARLAELAEFPGLGGRKPEWLRGIAQAAIDGRLDAERLRALDREQALSELKELPGIGDFSAELVLLRGAGDPDRAPHHEPRLARAVALAYRLPTTPTDAELAHLTENWRPYRTWVTLLLRAQLEDETGEIAGKPAANLETESDLA
jgi:DNA-3-methyladenine glycosylase II